MNVSSILFLLLVPIIGAFIGYLTNWLAVKMLFAPREPKKFLFLKFQGVFPKRQKQIAEKLGQLVAQQLLSVEDIKDKIRNSDGHTKIKEEIESKLDFLINEKFPETHPVMNFFVGRKTKAKLKQEVLEEVDVMAPEVIEGYITKLEQSIDVEQIVFEKVAQLSPEKLEVLIGNILQKEFKFIEYIGGVIGFILGLLQVGITLLV